MTDKKQKREKFQKLCDSSQRVGEGMTLIIQQLDPLDPCSAELANLQAAVEAYDVALSGVEHAARVYWECVDSQNPPE